MPPAVELSRHNRAEAQKDPRKVGDAERVKSGEQPVCGLFAQRARSSWG